MLRMPEFQVHRPATADEAVEMRSQLPYSYFIAGGTDIIPNIKHRLMLVNDLISLSGIDGMSGVEQRADGTTWVGASTTLKNVATNDILLRAFPSLAYAASQVAGPQHRTVGTIGGNVMLDTRCVYYNQTAPWREALGYCLKCAGTYCHVINSERSCVAAQCADSVPVLIALNASLEYTATSGPGTIKIADMYKNDGRLHRVHSIPDGALVRGIVLPASPPDQRVVYLKIRQRASVDYPQLAIALTATFDDNTVTSLIGVYGALLPKPKRIEFEEAVGTTLSDDVIEELAAKAYKKCRPQTNIPGSPAWRREMVRVYTARGLKRLRDPAGTESKS